MTKLLNDIHEYLLSIGYKKEVLEKYDNSSVYLALEIASYAHRNQKRLNGEMYISHPLNVLDSYRYLIGIDGSMFSTDTDVLYKYGIPFDGVQEVCLLHDVLEDTEITLSQIEELYNTNGFERFFNLYIKEALLLITHIKEEDYMVYINKLIKNPISSIVKMMDLESNLKLITLDMIDNKNIERAHRYIDYFKYINDYWKFIEKANEYYKNERMQ